MPTAEEASALLRRSERLLGEDQVAATVRRLAQAISARLSQRHPVVVAVMGGAVVLAGQILPQLRFPLDFDFMHVTRYDNATTGGELDWKVLPRTPLAGRTVLVLDDILDEGRTLAAIRDRFVAEGVAAFHSAVFCEKDTGRPKPIAADFVGVTVPDRYVFGFGMDVHGAWRNLPEIRALTEGRPEG